MHASSDMSPQEWDTRVQLAACYRLVSHFGMSDLIYNHITARIPDTDDHLLINPYGMMYDEITASNLVKIDLAGNLLGESPTGYGINAAGYVIHSAVHGARHDVGCVIHTHTRAGMAVSALKCGLLPLTQTAMRFAKIPYHDYESVAIDLDERSRLVADLGASEAMILRNHGLLAVGPTIAQAFNTLYWLEMACKAQVDALSANRELCLPPPEVIEKTWHLYQPTTRRPFGELEWPAMLRLMDRKDPGYKL
ncbi:class II aldolase/adducin family protein [Achromobacter kerstersii]|uniref:Decarboxylase NovR n=1 Tax=Achromobacter kerstersii TaxID=1353890 RepID=A0A6S7A9N2_9BURK|nr:class II aldolase/adducin family protein [Achromobacter kerstersii]CAB3660915.1 Decarboxylase NovR [Achromobacter kerstersii]CUJ52755.1 aldolase II superfamily protein [Achromobacter kerstersii]